MLSYSPIGQEITQDKDEQGHSPHRREVTSRSKRGLYRNLGDSTNVE